MKSDAIALATGSYRPFAARNGKWWHASEPAGLYIMYKLKPDTPDTDNGWVYGTVSTDGEVTSSGRVESCMACHRDAERDRVFGLID